VFAEYVRKDHALSLEQAVHKLTTLPADNLSLTVRGRAWTGTAQGACRRTAQDWSWSR
jgi:hypothetical protein